MKVRTLALILILGLLAVPLPAEGQKPGKMVTVGYLANGCGPTCKQFRGRLPGFGPLLQLVMSQSLDEDPLAGKAPILAAKQPDKLKPSDPPP